MNRLIDDLDQVIENREKSLSVYLFLKENELLDEEKVNRYNRFENNKSCCKHRNIIYAAGTAVCYDCGWEDGGMF